MKSLSTLRPDCKVLIHGLEDADELDRLAREINTELGYGEDDRDRKIFGVSGDVRKEQDCRKIVEEVHEKFGGLDVRAD